MPHSLLLSLHLFISWCSGSIHSDKHSHYLPSHSLLDTSNIYMWILNSSISSTVIRATYKINNTLGAAHRPTESDFEHHLQKHFGTHYITHYSRMVFSSLIVPAATSPRPNRHLDKLPVHRSNSPICFISLWYTFRQNFIRIRLELVS